MNTEPVAQEKIEEVKPSVDKSDEVEKPKKTTSPLLMLISGFALAVLVLGAYLFGKGETQTPTVVTPTIPTPQNAMRQNTTSLTKTSPQISPSSPLTSPATKKSTFTLSEIRQALIEKNQKVLSSMLADKVTFSRYATGYIEDKDKTAALTSIITLLETDGSSWNFEPNTPNNQKAIEFFATNPQTDITGHSDYGRTVFIHTDTSGIKSVQTVDTEYMYGYY